MIDIIQGIGDFFSSIGEWVSNTIQQAHDLFTQLSEWVDRVKTILDSVKIIIDSILPPEVTVIIITGIILILAICVWEIIN